MDFEKMSRAEIAAAKAAIARLACRCPNVPTRRFAPTRAAPAPTCARPCAPALRSGGIIDLKRKSRAAGRRRSSSSATSPAR